VKGVMAATEWEHRQWSDRRLYTRLHEAIRSRLPGF
jgi:hypothetical protein